MTLILPAALAAVIAQEARTVFPRECCGLIEGVWHGTEAHAMALYSAPAGNAQSFMIDPAVHLSAQKSARANGHRLIGCYHSHPNGAASPSRADLAGAVEENFVWLIAALENASAPLGLRAYLSLAGGFDEIGVATGADLVTSSSKLR